MNVMPIYSEPLLRKIALSLCCIFWVRGLVEHQECELQRYMDLYDQVGLLEALT